MTHILTLTMNPALDVSTSVRRVEPGRKLRCAVERRDPGGGGINVARVASRFGARTTAVYPAGGPTGEMLQALLAEEGIASHVIPIRGATREDLTVRDEADDDEYRFVLPGPHLDEAEQRLCLEAFSAVAPRPDMVCISGSLPPGVPADAYAPFIAAAAGWGAKMALDVSGAPLKAALGGSVHLIKPNLRELRELTGEALTDQAAMIAACRRLIAGGHAEIVALTLGPEGALLAAADRVLRAPALDIKPLSTVGAGDSFLAVMLWALAEGMSLEDAFRHAVAAGSAALMSPGTALATPEHVRSLLAEVTVERIAEGGARPLR